MRVDRHFEGKQPQPQDYHANRSAMSCADAQTSTSLPIGSRPSISPLG